MAQTRTVRTRPGQAPRGQHRVRRADVSPLLLLALACALGVTLLYFGAIRTELGQRLDDSASGSLSAELNPNVFQATDDLLRTIDVSSVAILGLGIIVLALMRRRIASAVAAGLLVIGANVTTQVLKDRLERPDLTGDGFTLSGSFPSGHTTVAMSLALALVLVASPRTQPIAATLGGVYAVAVGVGVLLLDWHRPSDVIGAYLVCGAWFGLAAAIGLAMDRDGAARDSRAGPWGIGLAGAVSAAFASVAIWAVWRRVDVLEFVGDRLEFVAASITVTVAAALLVVISTLLLRSASPVSPTGPRSHTAGRDGPDSASPTRR